MVKKYCPNCKCKNNTVSHYKLKLCEKCGYSLGSKDLEVSVTVGPPIDKNVTPFLIE